jgi:hypothetical protein
VGTRYQFRREDNDEVITVDFETMMTKDAMGCITLPDGVVAREIRRSSRSSDNRGEVKELSKPVVSTSLGCIDIQAREMQDDATRHGFTDVTFKPDPLEPRFFQAHCSSPDQWRRYIAHRGKHDNNSRNGSRAIMTPAQFEAAKRMILDRDKNSENLGK